MINWDKSAGMCGMAVDVLRSYFEKYPKSEKLVWWVCDGTCGTQKEKMFCYSQGMCHKCAVNTPEAIEANKLRAIKQFANPAQREVRRLKTLEQFSTQEACDEMSEIIIRYNKDHPEKAKNHSEWMIEYCKNPEVNKANSERIINSKSMQIEHDRQRGGDDIVWHHWLYDDADLSKYTMPMTRSEHSTMHNYMKAAGYRVPHINSETDDNDLWGYR